MFSKLSPQMFQLYHSVAHRCLSSSRAALPKRPPNPKTVLNLLTSDITKENKCNLLEAGKLARAKVKSLSDDERQSLEERLARLTAEYAEYEATNGKRDPGASRRGLPKAPPNPKTVFNLLCRDISREIKLNATEAAKVASARYKCLSHEERRGLKERLAKMSEAHSLYQANHLAGSFTSMPTGDRPEAPRNPRNIFNLLTSDIARRKGCALIPATRLAREEYILMSKAQKEELKRRLALMRLEYDVYLEKFGDERDPNKPSTRALLEKPSKKVSIHDILLTETCRDEKLNVAAAAQHASVKLKNLSPEERKALEKRLARHIAEYKICEIEHKMRLAACLKTDTSEPICLASPNVSRASPKTPGSTTSTESFQPIEYTWESGSGEAPRKPPSPLTMYIMHNRPKLFEAGIPRKARLAQLDAIASEYCQSSDEIKRKYEAEYQSNLRRWRHALIEYMEEKLKSLSRSTETPSEV